MHANISNSTMETTMNRRRQKLLLRISLVAFVIVITNQLLKWKKDSNEKTSNFLPEESVISKTECQFSDFDQLIQILRNDANQCTSLLQKIFELKVRRGNITLPDNFVPKVKIWLGENHYRKIRQQSILHAYNRHTFTTTVYNPLRASRPLPKPEKDPKQFIQDYLTETMEECDFCRYNDSTAMDTFGRLESKLAATSANAFKLQDFHSLVFPKRHSILDLSLHEFREVFGLANKWFMKVSEISKDHSHPQMIFDTLGHAGASQAHPHLHLFMGEGSFIGQFRHLDQVLQKHPSYMTNFIQAHIDIGLGLFIGTAAVIVPLDAHKDHEFLIISEYADDDWIEAFFAVYRTYVEELEVFCWSAGFALPPLLHNNEKQFPAVIRIGSRGNCQSATSDVSSLELYMLFNVNTNPFRTIEALKKSVEKRRR